VFLLLNYPLAEQTEVPFSLFFMRRIPGGVKEAYTLLKEEKGLSDLSIVAGILAIPVVVGAITICMVDGLFLRQARIAESFQNTHAHEN
jgi:hypothetical protein